MLLGTDISKSQLFSYYLISTIFFSAKAQCLATETLEEAELHKASHRATATKYREENWSQIHLQEWERHLW